MYDFNTLKMNIYLIGKKNGFPAVFKSYSDMKIAKSKFASDVQTACDSNYGEAFTFKVVKANSKSNAKDNYAKSRNYMRKSGSRVGAN